MKNYPIGKPSAFMEKLTKGLYKMQLDEAWYHERPEVKQGNRHWYEQIPCENGGVIYLYSDDERLLVLSTKKKTGEKVLKAVKKAKILAEFHNEFDILFPAAAFAKVAQIVKARRKLILTSEQRANLIEAGKIYQFACKNHGAEAPKKPRKSTPSIEHEETRPRLIRRLKEFIDGV